MTRVTIIGGFKAFFEHIIYAGKLIISKIEKQKPKTTYSFLGC
jgi:hypothetical protein